MMRCSSIPLLVTLRLTPLLVLLFAGGNRASAADTDNAQAAGGLMPPRPEQSASAWLKLRADLQSLFHLRNDRDFDRSAPLYNESGQSVGALATIFTPALTLNVLDHLRIYYEVELGLNFWSKQNPDQADPQQPDVFVLKQRQIYADAELADGRIAIKAGYAHYRDPTGLFLAHWIGMAEAAYQLDDDQRVALFAGQVPDQVYEGILLTENNFVRDIWVFGGRGQTPLGRWLHLSAAVTALYDTHLVDQRRWLVVPSARLRLDADRLTGFVDAALQAGQLQGQRLDGGDQTSLGWAAQASLGYALDRWELRVTALLLGPDDAYDGNDTNHAFFYSGKSASPTLSLTEDELRDWYDNLDERAARFRGGFLRNRAGLFVGDARLSWRPCPRIRASLILGAATALKPQNALGGTLFGLEGDLVLEAQLADYLLAHVVAGGVLPGKAGAALINDIDREQTDPIGTIEASLLLRY